MAAYGADVTQRHIFICAESEKAACCKPEVGAEAWKYLKARLKELKLDKQGGISIAEEIPTNELYGFPTAPDNTLVDAVNEAIQQLIDDGTLNDLYQQYFSTDAPESVTNPK